MKEVFGDQAGHDILWDEPGVPITISPVLQRRTAMSAATPDPETYLAAKISSWLSTMAIKNLKRLRRIRRFDMAEPGLPARPRPGPRTRMRYPNRYQQRSLFGTGRTR